MRNEIVMTLAMLAVLLGCAWRHDTAQAAQPVHNEQIIRCNRNLSYDEAEKVDERVNENSTLSEFYDTNGDDQADIEAISYLKGYDDTGQMVHDRFPFRWLVDLNYDGMPDKEYTDIGQPPAGRCNEIVFSGDVLDPKYPWPDTDIRQEGRL